MKLTETIPNYAEALSQIGEGASRVHLVMSVGISGVVRSHYGDNLWDFSPYIKPDNTKKNQKKIDFASLKFGDGSRLIDDQHSGLLASVKAFLYARLAHKHPTTGKTASHRYVIDIWKLRIRPLLHWMVAQEHNSFALLVPRQCKAYVEHCKQLTMNATRGCRRIEKGLSSVTLQGRFSLLQDLHVMRKHITDTLPEHPWPGESAGSLAGAKWGGHHRLGKTEQIPDRLNKQLAQGALYYVEHNFGARLLVLRKWRKQGRNIRWHLARLRDVHGQPVITWQQCQHELRKALIACYVTISEFTGLRNSEMISLEQGCYSIHEGWDGADYGWLSGVTYKLEEKPRPAEWMAPPIVTKAVSLADRLTAPLRAATRRAGAADC